jgi:N-acetylglucosamine-6-sulfatase
MRALLLVAVLTVLGVGFASRTQAAPAPLTRRADAPNILLINTDDQRWDTLWAMPRVQKLLVEHGVDFSHMFVSNSLCCPSRTSTLTGDYSHTTGVYRQEPPFGAFQWFRDRSTIATWLHDRGYATALFGKYVDAYQSAAHHGYVPPGWDRWMAFVRSKYYNYGLTIDGVTHHYGSAPSDYATNVLGDAAVSYLSTVRSPFFVYYAPPAPHFPAIPEAKYADMFSDLPPWRPPNYDEADMSDKPAYMRALPPLSASTKAAIDEFRLDQFRTLQSVDVQVGRMIDVLRRTDRLHDTMIIFMSDNGIAWGEHRWDKKEVPYDESLHVPLVIRDDAMHLTPHTDDHVVANIDIAPTIADAVGFPVAADGRSLVPLLQGTDATPWRRDLLLEHVRGTNDVPTFCGLRSTDYLYVRYATGEREIYDLRADPYELNNLAGTPAGEAVEPELTARLAELCNPPPPGMEPSLDAVGAAFVVAAFGMGAFSRRSFLRTRRRPPR